jgi:hypothetical protein
MRWDSNSVVEFVLAMCEALGSISSTNKIVRIGIKLKRTK